MYQPRFRCRHGGYEVCPGSEHNGHPHRGEFVSLFKNPFTLGEVWERNKRPATSITRTSHADRLREGQDRGTQRRRDAARAGRSFNTMNGMVSAVDLD